MTSENPTMSKFSRAAAISGLLAGPLVALTSAQDLLPKAAPQAVPVVIENATVHTVTNGVLEGALIEFEDGLIKRILSAEETAAGVAMRTGTVVLDGRGKHVYPGFVAANTSLGLTEVGAVDMTQDLREAGSITPEVRAAVAVNADSTLLPVTRRNGVLISGTFPQGGTVSGRASVLRLDGWTWKDMAIIEDAGLVVNWPWMGGGRARGFFRRGGGDDDSGGAQRTLDTLADLFEQCRAYLAARQADPSVETDLRLESVGPYLRGERPLFVSANSLAQIESAVRWCHERDLKVVLFGGRDAGLCLDLLREHEVMVALGGSHRMPRRRDSDVDESYRLPGLLEAAGLRWCMTMPGEASNARNLPYEAAACIAHGLPAEVALRSITISAAEALGIAERYGSLEAGKSATLFLCDGDAFELTTQVTAAFIDGRRIKLEDKQTQLDAKYREKYRQMGLLEGG